MASVWGPGAIGRIGPICPIGPIGLSDRMGSPRWPWRIPVARRGAVRPMCAGGPQGSGIAEDTTSTYPGSSVVVLRQIEEFFDLLLVLVGAHKKARRGEEDGLRLPQPRARQDRHLFPLRGPRPLPGRSEGNCLNTTSGGYPQRSLRRLLILVRSIPFLFFARFTYQV